MYFLRSSGKTRLDWQGARSSQKKEQILDPHFTCHRILLSSYHLSISPTANGKTKISNSTLATVCLADRNCAAAIRSHPALEG